MNITKKIRMAGANIRVSLAELTLFHFVAYGLVLFVAAWLVFHLPGTHTARYNQLRGETGLARITTQFDKLLQAQVTLVESLTRDPAIARLLLADNVQHLEERQAELVAFFPAAQIVRLLRPGEEAHLMMPGDNKNPDPAPLAVRKAQAIDIVRAVRVGQEAVGYLQVTFGSAFLQQMLDHVTETHGYVEIWQGVAKGQNAVLATRGDATLRKATTPFSALVPNSQWRLVFWPEIEGAMSGEVNDKNGSVTPVAQLFWSIFASALLLMALFAFVFSKLVTRLVRNDLNTLLAIVHQGKKNAEQRAVLYNFQSAMDALAKIMSHANTSLAVRKETLAAKARESWIDPWDLDDVMQIFQKDKPLAALGNDKARQQKAGQQKGNTMISTVIPASIFRAYDIRGVVGDTLTPEIVYELGRAIGSEAYARGQQTVIIARDGRLSGPEFVQALGNGLRASGRDVIDVGRVPTPVLYFATHYLSSSSGVMVTGSHNPPDYNGFKMVLRGETLAETAIQRLRSRIETGDLLSGNGTYQATNVVPDYIERITSDIRLARPLKVVVDCGNGVAGEIAPHLLRLLGCDVTELYCEIDGTFPNHHPDPSQPENVADLIQTVKKLKADVGLAFDGDGDRLGVISSQGEIIWADRQMMMYAKDVLSRNPGAEIIFDIKCSTHLARVIREAGGQPLMWKTGHSLVKAKMKETGAPLAGEMSGHIFFKERWYGFDDALYTAARLLEILARDTRSSSEVFAELPNAISTPELKIELQEGEQLPFVARLLEHAKFPDAQITTIDGLRADFKDGWGLVRASNTTPSLVLRFEADTNAALQRIQDQFRIILLELNPKLKLPF
jgi:phosphomannomutase/phosphoglucomutase